MAVAGDRGGFFVVCGALSSQGLCKLLNILGFGGCFALIPSATDFS
jgi:hypothetical protein